MLLGFMHGVVNSKTQFALKDLKALSIDRPLDTLGLLQAPRQLTERGPQHSYTFLHYAVQEFLAAYHISKLSSEEQSKEVSQILHNKPLSLVLPFFAGLTKLTNSSVCSILTEVTKSPLDQNAVLARMTQNPGSESSDSRKLLLALMNCIYESKNKGICKLVNFLPSVPGCISPCVTFSGLTLDPIDCISLGYFFANKQLDKVCELELADSHVGDIGVEVFMKELRQGYMSEEAEGIEVGLSGVDCSHHGVKCISETMSQTPILQGLHFANWLLYKVDAAASLKYLIEGLCRSSARSKRIVLYLCVSYKHTYHLILLIAFGNLQLLDLSYNDIGRSSVMSLLAQSLKHSRTLMALHMNSCNISDGGLQHLGTTLQDKTILCLSIADNPFSSEALTFFLENLCSGHSRLLYLQVESQRCKPAHYQIVQRINRQRLLPLEIQEIEKGPVESLVPAFFKTLTELSY